MPQLKSLLLPQLVEERKRLEIHQHAPDTDASYVYYNTNNSSASDITTPVTPTFSTRGHVRLSSSTSSLELPSQLHEAASSPILSQSGGKQTKQPLPDVAEEPTEPMERDGDETLHGTNFGLYSCLCDGPCDHVGSADDLFPADIIGDYDIDDYDMGFLSDGDISASSHYSGKKRMGSESPFISLTSRFGSRFHTINRWASTRKASLMSSPTTEITFENVLSRGPSSRSSSVSAANRHLSDRFTEPPMPPTPETSYHNSTDSFHRSSCIDIEREEQHETLQRDRAMATTPLLPPLLTEVRDATPVESPLQSPTVEPSSIATEIHSPLTPSTAYYSRPSLSSRPSVTSLRYFATGCDLPLPLPAMLQEHDEWSDRLGHANFTITPLPYQPETADAEAVKKFRESWEEARVNYTRHLVRTGENYGQTSKIYKLTEEKWAETEGKWSSIHTTLQRQSGVQSPVTAGHSRNRSRGRTRGRSSSASAFIAGRAAVQDDYAAMQWKRIEDSFPSAVPQMLEAMDAEGKFPDRGDEDIVGPMHREVTMVRTQSEEGRGAKFWKNLAGKVGIRK